MTRRALLARHAGPHSPALTEGREKEAWNLPEGNKTTGERCRWDRADRLYALTSGSQDDPTQGTGSLTDDNVGRHTQGTHGDTHSFLSPMQFIEIAPKGSAVSFLHASMAGMFSEVRREEPDCPRHATGGCRNPTDPPPDVPVHPDP